MPFDFDLKAGTVHDGALRYLLMRPDVLMGTGRKLGHMAEFIQALDESAYANARESFEVYSQQGKLGPDNFLEQTAQFAARLGWGAWTVVDQEEVSPLVFVRGSPFAIGAGHSDIPVCGPIRGILRALHLVVFTREVEVRETHCVAQGAVECRFEFRDFASLLNSGDGWAAAPLGCDTSELVTR